MESNSTTSSAVASATTTGTSAELTMPPQFKVVGIILAVVSGLLIGASFVFKKKGLIQSQQGHEAGEGVAYLKSGLWWTGMIMMILGEICNFAAYAFVEAIVVTPLGALSVVICAILSSFFLNEKLTFFGWVGCFLCIVGSVIIALNGPKENTIGQIREFEKLFVSVGFLVYGGVIIAASIVIIFFVAPKYGKKNMIWYILVCSLIGGLSFTYWFIYFLLIFVIITLLTEVYYLNVALALFNTAMVTPTYYVIFTFCTLVTSVILYRGFAATPTAIITVVMGFLVICAGITILQMSKVDPTTLAGLDRKTTILLAANRPTSDAEKGDATGIEEPGIDALRGSFGAIGSIVRARSIASSTRATIRSRRATHGHSESRDETETLPSLSVSYMKRHQLFDNPVPPLPEDAAERISMHSNANHPIPKKSTTIQFREGDLEGHDHHRQEPDLPLDDIIQRTASPRQQPLYDDPFASQQQQGYMSRTQPGYNPYSLRQDSLASLPEHSSSSPDGGETPPRSGGKRHYPPNREMDREESMSLVGAGRERDSREFGYDTDRQSTSTLGPPQGPTGGIRLVPSLPRR
ncbi:Magnesium transporter NIPA [Rhizoctonia solani]|uniref:Magnesium transporter NIPA n=1 Tax=Rhizoctonia solani TaxID=456999 RepID=A0A8H8P005_9AGAM|nr:Magnesium transporter NIPA [Rhizoctonia solani]QRW21832.1 Magnesium transporter NIPA [Rhizoctonia solani]